MPRRARSHLDHVPLHIVQRGHNRDACFFSEDDYRSYLYWLDEALRDAECTLHAYVLMTNHVHLLLTPTRAAAVPGALISLGRRYVQRINRIHNRTGTLWDSRYKSSLIHANSYLLSCQRYIELNPVRAGLVRDPADYRWSSYRLHAFGLPNPIVASHPLYYTLGRDGAARQVAYRRLVEARLERAVTDNIRSALAHGMPVGDSQFLAMVESMTGIPSQPKPRGRPRQGGRLVLTGKIEPGPI